MLVFANSPCINLLKHATESWLLSVTSSKIFVHGDLWPIYNPHDDNGICPLILLYLQNYNLISYDVDYGGSGDDDKLQYYVNLI